MDILSTTRCRGGLLGDTVMGKTVLGIQFSCWHWKIYCYSVNNNSSQCTINKRKREERSKCVHVTISHLPLTEVILLQPHLQILYYKECFICTISVIESTIPSSLWLGPSNRSGACVISCFGCLGTSSSSSSNKFYNNKE